MGKKLEKNALAKLTLADSCKIDLGESVTSVDSNNYDNRIVWGINHSNPISDNVEFMGQKVTITDSVEGTLSGTTFTFDYADVNNDTLVFQKYMNSKAIVDIYTVNTSISKIDDKDMLARNKIKNIYIPYGVKGLYNHTCSFTNISKIEIPPTITNIADSVFRACSVEYIDMPDSVKNLAARVFYECQNLKEIKLSNNITVLYDDVFRNCIALKSVILPQLLTTMSNGVFASCTNLAEITIPNSVTSIASNAFAGCTKLATITVDNVEGAIAGAETAWGCPNVNVQIIYTQE